MTEWEDEKVSIGKRTSYSMIWLFDYIVIAGQLLLLFHYYQVEIGLSTVLVGLAFTIFAIWNMINDPLIGFLTDKPMRWSKKWGLRMPWILMGGILTTIFYVLIFTVPNVDPKKDPWPIFWYIVIMICLYDTFYTILTCHAYGGFANVFRTREDRRKGGTIGQFMGTLSRFIMMGILIPLILVTGDPSSYIRCAIFTAIVIGIALVLFIPGIHESEAVKTRYLAVWEYLKERKLPYFKFLKIVFKQRNYMLTLFSFAMFTFSYALYYAATLYLVEDVLNLGVEAIAYAAISYTVGFLISIWIWSRFVADRLGHSNTWALGLIGLGVAYLAAMWYTTLFEYVLWHLIAGIASTGFYAVWQSVFSDAYDEVTNAAGVHQEAALVGINNFFFRFCWAIIGIVMAGIFIATGYVPGASKQSASAQMGIRILIGGIPAACCFIGAIVMVLYYNLKGEKREQLMKSLREKGL